MSEMISMSIDIHIFFVFLTLCFAIINLFVVKKVGEYVKMTKKVEMFTPAYYISLSIVMFTGFVVLAAIHFETIYIVYFMILVALHIITSAFKVHRLFKKTHLKDKESQIVFKKYAQRKYIVDIILIFATIIASFAIIT